MDEIGQKIAMIESALAKLDEKGNFRWEQMKNNLLILDENLTNDSKHGKRADEIMWASIERFQQSFEALFQKTLPRIEKRIDDIVAAIEDLRRRSMRYDIAYYQLFPDRLEQDAKLLDQLDSLVAKSPPDSDSPKM